MSDAEHTDAEQTGNKQPIAVRLGGVDWPRLGKLLAAVVLGLTANAVGLLSVVGGNAIGIADGVAYLAPGLVLGAWIHDQYNPVRDTPYLGAFVLFVTLVVANLISLGVRVFRTFGGQSDPAMTALILALLALLFVPGAFLGAWAARKWWL